MYKKTITLILIGCFVASTFPFLPASHAVNYGIETQTIDVNSWGTDCSLALDSNGYPHVSYLQGNQEGLKYALWNGSSWIKQVIEDGGVTGSNGFGNTLKLDSNGYPHICYFDYNVDPFYTSTYRPYLRYAHWDGSAWICETVDSNACGRQASLALDSQGMPHISYYDDSSLKYASWNGTQWIYQIVDPGVLYSLSIGTFSSLQIDSNNHPHIVYNDETNGLIKYANWNGNQWNIETIESGDNCDIEASLVLDPVGNPHVGYLYKNNLHYAVNTGLGWEIQTVDYTGETWAPVGSSCSLALDSKGIPHMSYIDSFRGAILKYAYLNGSSWLIYGLTGTACGGYATSIAVDINDTVHVVHGDYWNPNNQVMEYLHFNPADLGVPIVVPDPAPLVPPDPLIISMGPVGKPMMVDWAPNAGMHSSIALDSSGNPHVSYYDSVYGLKYAAADGLNWRSESADCSGWAGLYTSIALDSNGYPRISYFDNMNGLKYACWNGTEWNKQVVDGKGIVGAFSSLVLDSSNNPHISYFAATNEGLKYAKWDGSNWQFQIVDSSGGGEFTSIALDLTGKPCISYYDVLKSDLKFARWTGSNWNIQTVDSDNDVGLSTSLKIDQNNTAHISYIDATKNTLKYAKSTGLTWAIQTIDSASDQTSLALDTNGYPHISYYNAEKGNLGYTYWNGSAWLIQTPDSSHNVGHSCSLALDQTGRAHICYFDADNHSCKYIVSVNASGFPPSTVKPTPTPVPTPAPTQTTTSTTTPSTSTTPTPKPIQPAISSPNIDLACKSESGFNVQIYGKLTTESQGLSGNNIQLSYSSDNGVTWRSIATVKTSGTGQFTAQSTLPSAGVYLVRAFWTGNSTYSSASKIDNFVLAQTEGQNRLSINSNSTISAYQFNSTGKAFSFNVSGPAGTSGYASVYIPKSLIGDVTGLKIYLDGNELPYTTESDVDSWIVSFTYHHSSHKVDIQLPSLTATLGVDLPVFLIALLLIVPVVIAVGGLLVFYRGKAKDKLV